MTISTVLSFELFFRVALPLLFVAGYLLSHTFSRENGFYDLVKDALVTGRLPGFEGHVGNATESETTLKGPLLQCKFTGVQILDDLLCPLVAVMSAVYDGRMPELSVLGMMYGFSFASVCILVHLEAMRMGNRTNVIMRIPSLLVLLFEVAGFSVLGPLWMGLHVLLSPTRNSPTSDNISVELHDVQALPVSMIAGYLIPIMLPLLPDNLPIPVLSTVQSRIAAGLAFPTYLCFIQTFLAIKYRKSKENKALRGSPITRTVRNRSYLRRTYLLAFLCNAVPHVVFLTFKLLPRFLPTIFNPSLVPALGRIPIFESHTSASLKASSIHEGFYWYLEWQYFVGMSAFLLWGLACYASTKAQYEACWPRFGSSWLNIGMKSTSVALTFGLGAATVMLFWERDEVLMDTHLFAILKKEKTDLLSKKGPNKQKSP